MKVIGWPAYLIGGVLFTYGYVGTGMVVFGIGMIVDFKVWILGIVAFFVGFNWK